MTNPAARGYYADEPDRLSHRVPAVCTAETRSDAENLVAITLDVIDSPFTGLDTVYYLLKVSVFDLQSITDQ